MVTTIMMRNQAIVDIVEFVRTPGHLGGIMTEKDRVFAAGSPPAAENDHTNS